MGAFFRRLRARLKYRDHARELAREIDTHRAMAADRFAADGTAPRDAHAHASRLLGNDTLAREDARAVWVARWAEHLWQDARYAIRGLRRSPVFAVTAIGALGLGVSLNVSLFTVFNAVALRQWQVAEPDRVVLIQAVRSERTTNGISPVEGRYLQARARGVDAFIFSEQRILMGDDVTGAGAPARLVSANYFSALRMPLQHGAGFLPMDDDPAQARAVFVMGNGVWHRQFGGDPGIVGQTVKLNNIPFTVVGIGAEDARDSPLSPAPDAWLPIASLPLLEPNDPFSRALPTDPGRCCVKFAGRLRDGVTIEAAGVELAGLDVQYHTDQGLPMDGSLRVTRTRLTDQPQAARFLPIFAMMFAGTFLLLLLSCANVGNLLLARAMSRQREIGVRLALGAGRGRVIRQLLTEGLVLAAVSTAIALPIAKTLPNLVLRLVQDSGEEALKLTLDPSVVLFAALVAAASCLLFSLAPAFRGTRAAAASVRAGRSGSSGSGRLPLRTALLTVQIAISAVLLVAAGLLMRGIALAASADLGFTPDGVVAASIELPKNAYTEDASAALGDELARRLADADIGAVGIASVVPFGSSRATSLIQAPGGQPDDRLRVDLDDVSPGYFGVLHLRLISGRLFNNHEPGVVVINRALERRLAPGGSAIGLPLEPSKTPQIIVGVVGDAQLGGLGDVPPTVFRPTSGFEPHVLLPDTPAAAARLQSMLASLDPRAAVRFTRLTDSMNSQLRTSGFGAGVAAALGVAAIVLAAIGIFGVFSYMVTERSKEIGVRLALGARNADIIRTVLGGASIALGVGLGVGLCLALGAGSILSENLFGLSPRDPAAFAGAIGVLVIAALASTVTPVLRALRVDPAITLRQE
jgi:predicted permease